MSLLGNQTEYNRRYRFSTSKLTKRTVERIRYTVWVDLPHHLPPVRAVPNVESFPENQLLTLIVVIDAWSFEATLFLLRGVARMVGDEQKRRRVMWRECPCSKIFAISHYLQIHPCRYFHRHLIYSYVHKCTLLSLYGRSRARLSPWCSRRILFCDFEGFM